MAGIDRNRADRTDHAQLTKSFGEGDRAAPGHRTRANVPEWIVPVSGLELVQQLPILLFTLIGGVVADRYDRRQTLVGSQYVQLTSAFSLAALVYFGVVKIWHILARSFLTRCAQAFGGPASQALIPSLVSTKDPTNANALNSIQFNVARVIGPLLARITLVAFKRWGMLEPTALSPCFSLNGHSFLVVIFALRLLSLAMADLRVALLDWDAADVHAVG